MECSVMINTACSVFKILGHKIIYGHRFQTGWVQSFGRGITMNLQEGGLLQIGKHCVTRRHVTMRSYGNLEIGKKVFINENTVITCMKHIKIGAFSQIGNGVTMVDHDHDYQNHMEGFKTGEIIIGEYSWIGANAVLLRGTKIGDRCVVGAGAVVKGEFPDDCVIAGNPARIVKHIDYKEKSVKVS